MAKAAGAKVISTVGSAEKEKLASNYGSDVVINYKSGDVAASVEKDTGGTGVNVWYETQPPTDLDRTVELTAPRGRIVVMAGRAARPVFPNGPFYVKGLSLVGFAMFNMTPAEQRRCAEDMNRWLAEKKFSPAVGRSFKLDESAEAHKLQEENTLGKAGTLSGKIVVVPS
jgi:NADPH2:quinone reductase